MPSPPGAPRTPSFLDAPAYTVVQVPVPPFEPFVRARLSRWAPDFLRLDGGVHAHVTVLAPFLPEPEITNKVVDHLRDLCARTRPFTVRFAQLATFETGLTYAVPDPADAFDDLTRAVLARYPRLRPYNGEFEAVPHLSLDHADAGALALELPLPVTVTLDTLELVRYAPGDTRALRRWHLGHGPHTTPPHSRIPHVDEPHV